MASLVALALLLASWLPGAGRMALPGGDHPCAGIASPAPALVQLSAIPAPPDAPCHDRDTVPPEQACCTGPGCAAALALPARLAGPTPRTSPASTEGRALPVLRGLALGPPPPPPRRLG